MNEQDTATRADVTCLRDWRRAAAALAVVVSLGAARPVMAASASEPRVRTQAAPAISMLAGGDCHCAGWWTLDIADGRLETQAMGAPNASRALSAAERRELAALLEALPVDEPKYEFGVVYGDLPVFDLTVGAGPDERHYSVAAILATDDAWPELPPVLELMSFLRNLVAADERLSPPELDDDDWPADDAED